jgi:hypothetical protein
MVYRAEGKGPGAREPVQRTVVRGQKADDRGPLAPICFAQERLKKNIEHISN